MKKHLAVHRDKEGSWAYVRSKDNNIIMLPSDSPQTTHKHHTFKIMTPKQHGFAIEIWYP